MVSDEMRWPWKVLWHLKWTMIVRLCLLDGGGRFFSNWIWKKGCQLMDWTARRDYFSQFTAYNPDDLWSPQCKETERNFHNIMECNIDIANHLKKLLKYLKKLNCFLVNTRLWNLHKFHQWISSIQCLVFIM